MLADGRLCAGPDFRQFNVVSSLCETQIRDEYETLEPIAGALFGRFGPHANIRYDADSGH